MALCTEYFGWRCSRGLGERLQNPPASDLSYCMAAAGAAHSCAEQAKTESMVLYPSTERALEAFNLTGGEAKGACDLGEDGGMDGGMDG